MTPRLKEIFYKEIQPSLKNQFGFKNTYMGPKIEKIVLNMGLGLDGNDSKIMKSYEEDLGKITGQKPIITKFKKSVANFKTRKGTYAGLKVTLRKNKMYEFIDRLVNIALPRIKDFRGLSSNAFDNSGNYTLGIKSATLDSTKESPMPLPIPYELFVLTKSKRLNILSSVLYFTSFNSVIPVNSSTLFFASSIPPNSSIKPISIASIPK